MSEIDSKHLDPKLPIGTYSVDITTEGGAAIINGIPNERNTKDLKDHEIALLVNELKLTAIRYAGCGCMRDAISRVVLKHLKEKK